MISFFQIFKLSLHFNMIHILRRNEKYIDSQKNFQNWQKYIDDKTNHRLYYNQRLVTNGYF